MKTVFSNSQTCHVWAQQTQENGRNSSDTMYFSGTRIYSYGSHYLAANFIDKDIVLVNSYGYSPTTGQHLSDIMGALRGIEGLAVFTVPNTSTLKCDENYNHYNDNVIGVIDRIISSNKVDQWRKEYLMTSLSEAIEKSNKYFKLAGYPLIELDTDLIQVLNETIEKKYARFLELNSPENLAKKEALRLKKLEKIELEKIEKNKENIENFRKGENFNNMHFLAYDLVRVKGDILETSRKATVPVKEAILLLRNILAGNFKVGDNVGHFSLDFVKENENDKIVKIGCHKFLLSEGLSVLKQYL